MASQTWTSNSDFDAGAYTQMASVSGNLQLARNPPSSYDVTLYWEHRVDTGNSYTNSYTRDWYVNGSLLDGSEYSTDNGSFTRVGTQTYDVTSVADETLSAEAQSGVAGGSSDHKARARVIDSEGNTLFSVQSEDEDGSSSTKDWDTGSGSQDYSYLFDFYSSGSWSSETRTFSETVEFDELTVSSTLNEETVDVIVYDGNGNSTTVTLSGGTETFTLHDTSLEASTDVSVDVSVDNSGDVTDSCSIHELTVTAQPWPVPPHNVRVTSHGADSITVAYDDDYEYDQYNAYIAEASGTTTADYTQAASGVVDEAYQFEERENGEAYYARVASVESGSESALSAEVSQVTDLPAPTLDSLTEEDDGGVRAAYTLTDNSTDGSVVLQRSGDGGSTWSAVASTSDLTQAALTDTSSVGGTSYQYRVRRDTDHVQSRSGSLEITTTLAEPTGLEIVAIDGDQYDLAWTLQSTNEDGVRVYWSRDDGRTWTQGPDLAAGTESWTTPDLKDGERYRFAVEVFTSSYTAMHAPGLRAP